MPFQSESQRRFMHSQKPELAKEFEKKTPQNAQLPEKKPDLERRKLAMQKLGRTY